MITRILVAGVVVSSMLAARPVSDDRASRTPKPKADVSSVTPDDIASLVTGNNQFALDCYGRINDDTGNLIFSPLSISTAVAMLEAGARGQTAQQIRDSLHLQLPEERLHQAFAALLAKFNEGAAKGEHAPTISIANSLWGAKDYAFVQDYLDTVARNYDAGLTPVDFNDATGAAKRINAWVSDATSGKIQGLIDPSALDSLTRLVLVNAVYFKGQWLEPFDKNSTRDEDFHVAADRKKTVPMMHALEEMGYFENDLFQAVELGYDDSTLSMVVLLPRKIDGLTAFENSLTAETLAAPLQAMSWRKVDLSLPRFKFDFGLSLNDTLKALGMADAFSAIKADFSGIASHEGLYVSDAVHKAMIEVNEEGTEAAAATGIIAPGRAVSEPPPPPPVFRADHPFMFLIRDRATGSILFLGRVADPEA